MSLATYGFPTERNLAAGALKEDSSQLIEKRLIGVSRWAERARKLILHHASHNETVNLEGEPGTGKRLIAALIHQCSARREGPFVTLSFSPASVDVARAILFGSSFSSSTGYSPDEQG